MRTIERFRANAPHDKRAVYTHEAVERLLEYVEREVSEEYVRRSDTKAMWEIVGPKDADAPWD